MKKQLSMSIYKDLENEFKKEIEQRYKINANNFIEGFVYYTNALNLKKIFEFRFNITETNIKNILIDNNGSYKPTLKEYERIKEKVEMDNIKLSKIIRELIVLFVAYPNEFDEIFTRSNLKCYDESIDYSKLSSIIYQNDTKLTKFKYNFYLAQSSDKVQNTIKKYGEELAELKNKTIYSDFIFENLMVDEYKKLGIEKYSELDPIKKNIHQTKKEEYKKRECSKIMFLELQILRLTVIEIYKNIVNNTKRVSDSYTEIKTVIKNEHEKYKKNYSEIPLIEYVERLMYSENALFSLYYRKIIKF